MQIRVGKFTCELSLDDDGRVQAQWLPSQPKYLNRVERGQYRAGRAAFLEGLEASREVARQNGGS